MVVGCQKKGKTSLLTKLAGRAAQQEDTSLSSSVRGRSRNRKTIINQFCWEYKRTSNVLEEIKNITYKVWDFGGQVGSMLRTLLGNI